MPKSVRVRTLKNMEAERLTDEEDHLYASEDRPSRAMQKIHRALRIDPPNVGALYQEGEE